MASRSNAKVANLREPQWSREDKIAALNKELPFAVTPRDQEFFDWLTLQKDLKLCGRVSTSFGPELTKVSQMFSRYKSKDNAPVRPLPFNVVYVPIDLNGGVNTMYRNILSQLDHPFEFDSKRQLRRRTKAHLKRCGVNLLIIDNAPVLQEKALHELARIYQLSNIPIVVLGNRELFQKLKKDPYGQADIVFAEEYYFRALNQSELLSLIEHWETNILTWRSTSLFAHSPELCKQILSFSGHSANILFGKLKKLAYFSIQHGIETFTPQDVEEILM